MKNNILHKMQIKISLIISLFFLILIGSNFSYAESLEVRSGGNYWFNNPARGGERVSDFTGYIDGVRAWCIDSPKIAKGGTVTNKRLMDKNAASVMYYQDKIGLWDADQSPRNNESNKITWDIFVSQMAFWQVVDSSNFNVDGVTVNEGFGESYYIARRNAVVEDVKQLSQYARDHADDLQIDGNMSVSVNDSEAKIQQFKHTNKYIVGPYKVNVTNASGPINVTKLSGDASAVSTDVNGNGISTISNGQAFYVLMDHSDSSVEATFRVGATTGTSVRAYRYDYVDNTHGSYQNFAKIETGNLDAGVNVNVKVDLPKRKVYVKHVDKEGKPIAGIESKFQIEQLGNGNKVRINNLGSYGAYQESYRFGMNSVAYISKSPNYKYKYLGGKKASGGSYESANSNLGKTSDTWDSGKTSVTTNPAINGVEDVTVVEFIYENSPNVDPVTDTKIFVDGGKPNSEGCDTTYTPSGEAVKPYIKTSKYFLNEIEYELTDTNTQEQYDEASAKGEILEPNFKYRITKLSVFKLKEGYIENGATQEEMIFGSSKTTLFSMNSGQSLEFKGTNVSYGKLNNLSELPTTQEIENALGSKSNLSNSSDFSRSITVNQDKFNGIRKINGSATYQLYDVLNNSYGAERTYKTSNRQYVNVYTPAVISEVKIKTDNFVDHSVSGTASNVIQKNADFTLKITPGIENKIYSSAPKDTKKYISGYVVVFDFAVTIRRKNISSRS